MSQLETRLQKVEGAIEQLQGQRPTEHNADPQASLDAFDEGTASQSGAILISEAIAEHQQIDAMGAVVFDDEEESGFFGRL